jgi:hypothetical protein
MAFASVNGQQIYFEDTAGQGAPVVLAHGFLMDHEMFAPQVASREPAVCLPGSDGVVKVPGAHAANLTHPGPVNAAIGQFLAGLPD